VGIGASAGGIPTLTAVFAAVPPLPGMAFVVIQHLPPEFSDGDLLEDVQVRWRQRKARPSGSQLYN
jgi:CheB methylesterase